NRKAYDDLIGIFTQKIEPRDEMELMWVKQATDATWEERRIAREKNALPEWKYQERHILDAAQSRAIKRRDDAVGEIKRWRAGLGATPRRLPDELLCEQPLAEHYGVDKYLADAKRKGTLAEAEENAATLAPDNEAAGPAARQSAHKERRAETPSPH